MQQARRIAFGLFSTLVIFGALAQLPAAAQDRFEVTSIKAVRPTIVNTIGALEKRDVAAARDAFEAYDSGWNGIEFYINTRSRPMYDLLEHQYQPKITKALNEVAELGVTLAIDDFGTGYSSLGYLKHFPFNRIKIDGAFVRDIDSEDDSKAIVKATTYFEDAKAVLEACEELGEAMPGIDVRQLEEKDMLSTRGW